jgi:hypothetical protein
MATKVKTSIKSGVDCERIRTVKIVAENKKDKFDITFWQNATLSGWSGTAQQLHDALMFAALQPESTRSHQNAKVRSLFGGE